MRSRPARGRARHRPRRARTSRGRSTGSWSRTSLRNHRPTYSTKSATSATRLSTRWNHRRARMSRTASRSWRRSHGRCAFWSVAIGARSRLASSEAGEAVPVAW